MAAEAAAAAPIWPQDGPHLVKAEPDEIVYEIIVNLPDAGLLPGLVPDAPDEPIAPAPNNDTTPATSPRQYPTRSRSNVVGNQPYDTYAPRMQFLQLGEVRAHWSALSAAQEQRERELPSSKALMHVTTSSDLNVDDTVHQVNPELHTPSENEMAVWGYLMTQYNLKPGLRKFGERGATAAISELTQLHVMDTWTVMDPTKLTRDDRTRALSSLLFLKEKRCGKVKGRACVNGAPQRAYIPKEDAALPTVSTESMFITSAISASKKRYVRCYNVPSAFVNTDVDENMLMVLKGEMVEMMVHITLQIYRKHITANKKSTPVLYVKLQKALYGMQQACCSTEN